MSIASLLSIKVTSPITHMVSSAVRGVAASLLGMWLFHDIITTYVFSHITVRLPPNISVRHQRARLLHCHHPRRLFLLHLGEAPRIATFVLGC